MKIRLFISSTALVLTLAGPVFAQDEYAARELLVEAIRALDSAQSMEDPIAKEKTLKEGVAALDEILGSHAATVIGLELLTGGVFNNFNPGAVRIAFAEAQKDAEVARCGAKLSTLCFESKFREFTAEAARLPVEQVERAIPNETKLLLSASTGAWSDEDVRLISKLDQMEFGATFMRLWQLGRSVEMFEMFSSLPPEHPARSDVPDIERMQDDLYKFVGSGEVAETANAPVSLQRLLDNGVQSLDGTILQVGSREQIDRLLSGSDDPVALLRRWREQENIPRPGTANQAKVAIWADLNGHRGLALEMMLMPDARSGYDVYKPFLAGASQEGVLAFARAAIDAAPAEAHSIFWDAMAVLDGERESHLIEHFSAADAGEGSRGDRFWYEALEAGTWAGERGITGLEEVIGALSAMHASEEAKEGYRDGLLIGRALADDDRGADLVAEARRVGGIDGMRLIGVATYEFVRRGKIEEVRGYVEQFGMLEDWAGSYDAQLEQIVTAATIGDLGWLIRGLEQNIVSERDAEWALTFYTWFLRALQMHDIDMEPEAADVAALLRAYDDDTAAEKATKTLAQRDTLGFDGAPLLVYRAGLELGGARGADALREAYLAAQIPQIEAEAQ